MKHRDLLPVSVVFVAAGFGQSADPAAAAIARKTAMADIAMLQTRLGKTPDKGSLPTLKTTAMMIALYAQSNMTGADADGMAALRAQALRVAEALSKKDYAAAGAEAAKLANPPPSTEKGPLKLHEMHRFDREDLMFALRGRPRGLNVENDIRGGARTADDPKVLGELGSRTALLMEYTAMMPNEKALKSPEKTAEWKKYANDLKALSFEVQEDSTKGANADKAALQKKLATMDQTCVQCHAVFGNG